MLDRDGTKMMKTGMMTFLRWRRNVIRIRQKKTTSKSRRKKNRAEVEVVSRNNTPDHLSMTVTNGNRGRSRKTKVVRSMAAEELHYSMRCIPLNNISNSNSNQKNSH